MGFIKRSSMHEAGPCEFPPSCRCKATLCANGGASNYVLTFPTARMGNLFSVTGTIEQVTVMFK